MPDSFTATELLVFVHGLSTTTALICSQRVDDWTMDGISSRTSCSIVCNTNTIMSNTSMMTRSAVHNILASTTNKQTVVTGITEETVMSEVFSTFAAIEALKVIVLVAYNLVQQTTTLLLANRANDIFKLAWATCSHSLLTRPWCGACGRTRRCYRITWRCFWRDFNCRSTLRCLWRILSFGGFFDGGTAFATEARTGRKTSTAIDTKNHRK